VHIGAPLHWLLLTHWLLRAQPLQHCAHSHGVLAGLGPQPAVVRLFLQQKPPTQLELPQHSGVQLQLCPFVREQAAATHTLSEHAWPQAHAPPHVTVRAVPQLSGAVTAPQFFPGRVQKSPLLSATQVHWPFAHVRVGGVVQLPHEVTVRMTPQLSGPVNAPQTRLWREQNTPSDSGMQAQVFDAAQVCGMVQVPQLATVRMTPQLSLAVTWPHVLPRRAQKVGLSSGVHEGQTFGVTAPQVPLEQVPQDVTVRGAPHESVPDTWPQFLPRREQNTGSDSGTQRQRPPSHAVPASRHAPQMA
jgi:hypothetical protein